MTYSGLKRNVFPQRFYEEYVESLSIDQECQGVMARTSDRTQDTHNHARRTHLTHHTNMLDAAHDHSNNKTSEK